LFSDLITTYDSLYFQSTLELTNSMRYVVAAVKSLKVEK